MNITTDMALVPVNFENTTVLLGNIKQVRNQSTQSRVKDFPAEVIFTDGTAFDIPLTVEQATERMFRRSADFARLLRG